jgi:U6 snRNA-associated Sm-like protein LSm4
MPECYIRGNSIKYLRIPDEIIDLVAEDEQRGRKVIYIFGSTIE